MINYRATHVSRPGIGHCQREALMIDQKRQGYSDAFLRDPTLTPAQLDVDATCC